ncbi:pentapeptide repeat-containing protein [Neolewinella persica]|uniref:pentapeptide repeat-containing protein n=1 Tax=Neolewinella persica TaxID=70998 RepID=UPI000365E36B|nr:pentapeptide repeat-containing protein [Neolewinella persica]
MPVDRKISEEAPFTRKELEEKLAKIRNDLIQQEHRFVPAIRNLYLAVKNDDKSPVARERTLSALYAVATVLWRRRAGAIIVASIGGAIGVIIGIATLLELREQNHLFIDQNQEMLKQNILLSNQNQQQIIATNGEMVSALIGDLFEAKKADGIHVDSTWSIPKPLIFRILAVSNALTPYTEGESYITDSILFSRERGELLLSLTTMNVDFPILPNPNFSFTALGGVSLRDSIFGGIKLVKTDLVAVNLRDSDLREVNFNHANLIYANFRGANLHGARFVWADLTAADFTGADLTGVNFSGADLTAATVTVSQLSKTYSLHLTEGIEPWRDSLIIIGMDCLLSSQKDCP